MSGFTEVLTFVLCSHKEIFSMLNREDDKSTAVRIANPRSTDNEVCQPYLVFRTTWVNLSKYDTC